MSEENGVPVPTASEIEARKFGWVAQDEYQGDPAKWRDADAFLAKGKEINGFLRNDMEKIKLAHKQEIDAIRASVEEIKKIYSESNKQAYARAKADLKKEKADAITQGDGERVLEIDEQLEKVREAETASTKVVEVPDNRSPQENDRVYYDWLEVNQWYITDKDASKAAEDFGALINVKKPHLKGKDFFDEVTRMVKEAMPEKFENPNRSNSQVSNSSDGRNPSSKPKKKSYENLPPEGKKQCDIFVSQGLMTKEEYVAQIDWDDI